MRQKQKQSRYRGYIIEMKRPDLCWRIALKPSLPGLPAMKRRSFPTATQSERMAMAQAKRLIDRALSQA